MKPRTPPGIPTDRIPDAVQFFRAIDTVNETLKALGAIESLLLEISRPGKNDLHQTDPEELAILLHLVTEPAKEAISPIVALS